MNEMTRQEGDRRKAARLQRTLDTTGEPTIADLNAIMDALLIAADLEAHALGLDRLVSEQQRRGGRQL